VTVIAILARQYDAILATACVEAEEAEEEEDIVERVRSDSNERLKSWLSKVGGSYGSGGNGSSWRWGVQDGTNVEFCRKMANIYIYIKGALFK